MSQELIFKKAEAALRANHLDLVREIFSSAEEKPNSETTGKILVLAAQSDIWDLVNEICLMDGGNKADEPAIAKVLEEAYNKHATRDFKWICQKSRTAPNRTTIESLLKKAINASDNSRWEYIAYLCFLETENKPSQEVIDKALREAAIKKNWDLALRLVKIKNTNTTSEPAIAHALLQAYEQNQFDHFVSICELSTTPPSQDAIDAILNKEIAASGSTRLPYIEYLCLTYKKIQPGKTYIDKALKYAAYSKNWELALGLIGKNKPSELVIAEVLQIAYNQNLFDEFTSICKASTTPLSQATINSLLETAIKDNGENRWKFINYLCFLKSENKPGQSFINKALKDAAKYKQWKLAIKLTRMTGVNQPTQEAIEFLLEAAAKAGELGLIQELCALPLARRPRNTSIKKGFVNAAAAGQLYTLIFFSEMKSDNKPPQSTIENAFIQAVSAGQINVVDYFIFPENRIELKPAIIEKAILAAPDSKNGLDIIKRLKPSQESPEVVLPKPASSVGKSVATKVIPAPKAQTSQLQQIQNAVTKAQGLYQEWYADKDGKKNIRCANGFFSHWRHGASGQQRAKDILARVNLEKTAKDAASFVNAFLTDDKTAYERHSFSSFLIDELKKIKGGSWSGITLSDSLHYDQNDVNQQLTPRQSNRSRR